jgi:uncharacterized protein (TIGR00251 family)
MALLNVKVVPGARRTEIVGRHGDGIKVRVAAPPEDGKANRALLDSLSEALGVKASTLRIVRGLTSPQKVVEVDGLSLDQIFSRLAP